jgi:hypothetical protein
MVEGRGATFLVAPRNLIVNLLLNILVIYVVICSKVIMNLEGVRLSNHY